MVEFKNIKVENGYIYASETNLMTGEKADIKVHITNDECYTNPTNLSVPMRRAIWNLQLRYKKNKKLSDCETINWG